MSLEELRKLDDVGILQCCIWGEARGESLDGKVAVGNVVKNRVEHPGWWGDDWHSVCLKRWQFSCFNPNDPNFPKMLEGVKARWSDPLWREIWWIAKGIIGKKWQDNTNGANHYCHIRINPSWSRDRHEVARIGNHKFFAL